MVEEGQIDWAGYDNNPRKVITDIIALDDAVEIAKEYVDGTGDSLLIVTADHETGGLAIGLAATGKPGEDGPYVLSLAEVSFSPAGQLMGILLPMCR